MNILIVDLETENRPWYGQMASPFNPENYIVMPGWLRCTPNSREFNPEVDSNYVYYKNAEEANAGDWLDLTGVDALVAHNASFETMWLLHRHRDKLEEFLKRGGRILCTQMAEYLLSHQTHIYPALNEIAPKYGGTQKVDAVKILWDSGKKTSEIDPELLAEYLAGAEGDLINTAKVFIGQIQALHSAGMWNMYLQRCENLLYVSYCMFNGLHIEPTVASNNAIDIQNSINTIYTCIESYVQDTPKELEFNWGSDYHVSAVLFGGTIKYTGKVPRTNADGSIIYSTVPAYQLDDKLYPIDGFDLDAYPNVTRYSSGRNKGLPKEFKLETTEPQYKNGDMFHTFPGIIKLSALPEPIRSSFIGDRAANVGKRNLTCGTPVYSTSGEVLQALAAHGYDVCSKLAELNKLDKDLGTYYSKTSSTGKVSGMLQFVENNNIIHHKLNCTSTVTGRLSASQPNLQNLPREGTSKVKQMFTSRFPGGQIIEVDYSALEVVMSAALSGDDNLLDLIHRGVDMHCYRLAFRLGRPYEDVKADFDADGKDGRELSPNHKEIARLRKEVIKPISFAAQYGASANGIAYNTGVPVEEAQAFLDNEAKLFPISIAYRQEIRDKVECTGGYPEGLQREVSDDGTWRLYRRGYWQSPGGTCYSFRQHPRWRNGQQVMDYKDTELANYWCQGESAYLMAVAAGLVIRWLLSKDFFDGQVVCINQVHDAIYLDCAAEHVHEVGNTVAYLMSYAPKYMSEHLGYHISHIPFPAVAEAGFDMFTKNKLN